MSKIVIAEKTYKWVERCDELNKELAKLKHQLEIAVKDLYVIANNANPDFNRMEYAEKSLKKIKELEK